MVHFYKLSPLALVSLPDWLYEPLELHYEALRAEEMQMLVMAMSAPFQKPHVFRSLRNTLQRIINRFAPKRMIEVIEEDPEKAATYFREIGAKVISSSENEES